MNTPQKGKFRHIVFREGQTWYAVAMEFNIIESSDDPTLAFMGLLQAVSGYVASLKKVRGMRFAPLNQAIDPEYEKLWKNLTAKHPVASPFEVAMFGYSRA